MIGVRAGSKYQNKQGTAPFYHERGTKRAVTATISAPGSRHRASPIASVVHRHVHAEFQPYDPLEELKRPPRIQGP